MICGTVVTDLVQASWLVGHESSAAGIHSCFSIDLYYRDNLLSFSASEISEQPRQKRIGDSSANPLGTSHLIDQPECSILCQA